MQYLVMMLRAAIDPSLPARQLSWHSPPPIITYHHACPVLSRLNLPYLALPYRILHCLYALSCPTLPCPALRSSSLLNSFVCFTALLYKGASMQRVLRGQWREDILWTLHEVLLSKRMIDHHSLEEHIKTLSRC